MKFCFLKSFYINKRKIWGKQQMHSENPILTAKKPMRSGIHRHLITRQYKMGSTFLIKDGESYYDVEKIQREKVELQYS